MLVSFWHQVEYYLTFTSEKLFSLIPCLKSDNAFDLLPACISKYKLSLQSFLKPLG